MPDSLKVIAAQIRSNVIGALIEDLKDYLHEETMTESVLGLISYINNLSDEEILLAALNNIILHEHQFTESVLPTLRSQYESLTDLPF